jgi:hypothetical protein
MLFGLRSAVDHGNYFMRHRTGFTQERLGNLIIAAGFHEARVLKGGSYDLWALGLMSGANREEITNVLSANGLAFHFCGAAASGCWHRGAEESRSSRRRLSRCSSGRSDEAAHLAWLSACLSAVVFMTSVYAAEP